MGTFVSLLVGIGVAVALPAAFWGNQPGRQSLVFALFLGMCLANSANPVIARILHDLGLLKSDLGAITMTATVVDDLVDWTLLAVVLSQLAPSGSLSVSLPVQLGLLVLFFVLVLGVGHLAAPKILAWARTRLAWPSGFLMMTTLVILAAGAASEWLGLHAFLAGVALGSEDPCDQEAHELIANFALSFFAPLYFVSIGLQANYLNNFAALQVLVVLAAAFASKFGGVLLAARMAGMRIDRPVWAIAFGLNARGATGIILAGIGLEHGLIDQTMFVTLVIMALVTSLVAGPAIKWLTSR